MGQAAYSFFRYRFTDSEDDVIGAGAHLRLIQAVAGQEVPHRKRDPAPHEHDTFIMRVRPMTLVGHHCIIFDIARRVTLRVETRYDPRADDIRFHEVRADDTHWTHIVMVPRAGRVAVKDGSGERLSADSGASRVRSVVRALADVEFEYERTATPNEISEAVSKLDLTTFSFTVTPFNPHPHIPGEQMDALLKAARVKTLTAKAEPAYGGSMTAADEGIIAEAVGLAKEGYGQYGFKGMTEAGTQVAFNKPKMEPTREGNLKRQAKNAALRVIVPDDDEKQTEEEFVVRTMVELYGDG
jgi:hypothetical protein